MHQKFLQGQVCLFNAGVHRLPCFFPIFFYSVLMIFVIIFVILQSILILLSTLNATRLLISGKSLSWLLNLNLTFETLWISIGSGLLISVLESLTCFIDCSNKFGAIDLKIGGSSVWCYNVFKIGLSFFYDLYAQVKCL